MAAGESIIRMEHSSRFAGSKQVGPHQRFLLYNERQPGFGLFKMEMAVGGRVVQATRQHAFVSASSTPSQTAWALLALVSAEDKTSDAVQRGVNWLLTHQESNGGWHEHLMTGTGFPNVFYLQYHLYSHYFPLLALGTWRASLAKD